MPVAWEHVPGLKGSDSTLGDCITPLGAAAASVWLSPCFKVGQSCDGLWCFRAPMGSGWSWASWEPRLFPTPFLVLSYFLHVLQPRGKWKPLSSVWLFVTPWTIQSMEFSRPEYWRVGSLSLLQGSSHPRNQTQVSRITGRFFTNWATEEAQGYWSGQPISPPGDLPDPGVKLGSPALQVDSLPIELSGTPLMGRAGWYIAAEILRVLCFFFYLI